MKAIIFAGKMIRMHPGGLVEVSRLVNAKTGETKWLPISQPTEKLLLALRRAPQEVT